jgi:hypothetical protein
MRYKFNPSAAAAGSLLTNARATRTNLSVTNAPQKPAASLLPRVFQKLIASLRAP